MEESIIRQMPGSIFALSAQGYVECYHVCLTLNVFHGHKVGMPQRRITYQDVHAQTLSNGLNPGTYVSTAHNTYRRTA